MALKERITEDMKSAMRSGEKERLATIRMILAGIKQREVDERIQLDDAQVTSVLEKMIKTRKESVVQFRAGGRTDLVDKENAEIALIQLVPACAALRCRARCAHRRGDRLDGRRFDQGYGQGDGRHQGEGRRARRHGDSWRQGKGEIDLTTLSP